MILYISCIEKKAINLCNDFEAGYVLSVTFTPQTQCLIKLLFWGSLRWKSILPQVPNIYCSCYILSLFFRSAYRTYIFLSIHLAIFDICGKYEKIRRKIMLTFLPEKYGFMKIYFMLKDIFHFNCHWKSHILSLRKMFLQKWDALRDLIPFVQFKKRKRRAWRSVTFSKVAGLNLQVY